MAKQSVARFNMIEGQIRPNDVTDSRIIAAFGQIPREQFVPPALRGVAYVDEDIEVAPGRYLMEPMVLARLIDAAGIGAGDVVLDLGCVTGYSSAVLAQLAGAVVAVEEDKALAARATALLTELQCDNVAVVCHPLTSGFAGQAPYDVILVNGMFDELPKNIEAQLAEGGRLVGVMNADGAGKAVLYVKRGGLIGRRELFDAAVAPLPGFQAIPAFTF